MGRAIARRFAEEGCRVALCARQGDILSKAAGEIRGATGAKVLDIPADLTKAEDVRRTVDATVEGFGGLDILLVNAGGPPAGFLDNLDDATWARAYDLTLMSAVRLIRKAMPHLKRSRAGRIVAISSTSIKEPIENLLLSNSLRLAVAGLLKTVAREAAPHGITVNAVLPGYVETNRLDELFEGRARAQGKALDQVKREVAAEIPVGRLGRPEEVADLVAFLASDRAAYITGTFIPIDGGRLRGY